MSKRVLNRVHVLTDKPYAVSKTAKDAFHSLEVLFFSAHLSKRVRAEGVRVV